MHNATSGGLRLSLVLILIGNLFVVRPSFGIACFLKSLLLAPASVFDFTFSNSPEVRPEPPQRIVELIRALLTNRPDRVYQHIDQRGFDALVEVYYYFLLSAEVPAQEQIEVIDRLESRDRGGWMWKGSRKHLLTREQVGILRNWIMAGEEPAYACRALNLFKASGFRYEKYDLQVLKAKGFTDVEKFTRIEFPAKLTYFPDNGISVTTSDDYAAAIFTAGLNADEMYEAAKTNRVYLFSYLGKRRNHVWALPMLKENLTGKDLTADRYFGRMDFKDPTLAVSYYFLQRQGFSADVSLSWARMWQKMSIPLDPDFFLILRLHYDAYPRALFRSDEKKNQVVLRGFIEAYNAYYNKGMLFWVRRSFKDYFLKSVVPRLKKDSVEYNFDGTALQ